MVKGVIFDVDGVLLNSMPVWENLGELYLQRLGIEAEKDLGTKLYTMSLEQSAQYMIETYHLDLTPEQVIAGVSQEVKDFYAERVPLKEGVRQYLNEFRERGVPMAIATTGDRKNAEAALKRLNIYRFFQGVFTCSEIGSSKNEPDIYYAAALQLDTDPGQTWVFEDAPHAAQTAANAGFLVVGVHAPGGEKHEALLRGCCRYFAASFAELIDREKRILLP